MKSVESCTEDLINSILESDEYVEFRTVRERLRGEPDLHRQINDFRVHIFEVQNSREPLDMYEEQRRLCRDYEEFRKNPLVNDFLQAELGVCRLIQQIADQITKAVDLDTDDVAERIGL
jgi:cell fate (sporulation/competence/biofilm development) regulator YlbF (YheA/YmcA/DUF963 family)